MSETLYTETEAGVRSIVLCRAAEYNTITLQLREELDAAIEDADRDRDARVILANANRDSEIARGEGDAEATRIYAEAYGSDPDFYSFTRSLEAYRKSIDGKTTLVLSPDSEFFRYLQSSQPSAPGPVSAPPGP